MITESNDASLFDFEEESTEKQEKQEKVEKTEDKKDAQFGIFSDSDEFEKNLELEVNPEDEKDNESEDEEEKEEDESKDEKSKEEVKEEFEDDSSYSFKAIASFLDEEGIIDFEDSKELEDNPDLLATLVKSKIEQEINSYKESLPEVVEELVDFIEKGGDPEKFLTSVTKEVDYSTLDLEDEANQELIVKEYLKSQDYSKEEIDELLEDYKDGLILEKQARFASKKLEKLQENKKQRLIEEQEALIEEQNKKVESYKNSIKETIQSNNQLAGLNISKKEKQDFEKYLLDINPKTGMTKYQEEVSKNQLLTQVELAYLKFKNYDFGSVKKEAKSEAAKDFRKKIFTKNESTHKGKSREEQGVANFEAFKSMFGRK